MSTEDPLLTPDQAAFVAALDALCAKTITDGYLYELDRAARYPAEAMDALAGAGWAELCVPAEYGGQGASAADLCVMLETIARHSLVVAQAVYSLWIMGGEALQRLGDDAQRKRWLPPLAAGAAKVAIALTEPGSGSDAAALRTEATRDGDDFVLNGQKVFITGATIADVIITGVRTAPTGKPHAGISTILVEPGRPGVTVRRLDKMGLKALDLCEIYFDDVRVPATELLGGLNDGWAGLKDGLAKERLFLAAISNGALRDVLDRCLEHAQHRSAFGRPIASHQLVADKLVTMRGDLEAGRGLVGQAAQLVDRGHADAQTSASIAKLMTTRAYIGACREGVQIFGGYGFTDEYPISRHYRDCKYLEIGGGTSEIQKIVIARAMGVRL